MFNMGERIQEIRLQCGMSQNELAERAGISASYLRQLELGKRQTTLTTIAKIAKGLGVKLEFLFESTPKNLSEEEKIRQRIRAKMGIMSTKQLMLFSNIVDIFSKYD